ncbi:hypothetical protein [Streptomyces sp. SID11385]|uniref:hypothetical protein n=1 Tax=Streptomyces sp. SID11385 TaxID=2706031 RepID=UPI0013CA09A1|nr:hypothetical protein [Streptomyces sp. SID11385]NEA37795.1 hypothetical protein [Streptomyces sp. SID11385]
MSLDAFAEEHAEALEADLLRHFGLDLLDWHRDERSRLSSRRLALLIRHLPRDSATVRATEGEAAEWSVTDYLLAAVVDHLAAANWMFSLVNSDGESEQPDMPEPVPRPGQAGTTAEAPASLTPDSPEPLPAPHELSSFFR